MLKEMKHLFATRFGMFPPHPSVVGFMWFIHIPLTRGSPFQNAGTEGKQETAFELDHRRRRIILVHYALDYGWG